jgi:multidrug efflux pump subunit AcrA (membrane-fusion protein)
LVRQKDQTGGQAVARHKIIRKAAFGRGVKCFEVIACLAAMLHGGCSKSPTSSVLGNATHPTPVHFYTVAEETARRRIQAVGSLFALEESALSSQVDGRVADVLADVGDTVKEGQALITLDPQELEWSGSADW